MKGFSHLDIASKWAELNHVPPVQVAAILDNQKIIIEALFIGYLVQCKKGYIPEVVYEWIEFYSPCVYWNTKN
jgi:hypothetical protein